MRTLFVDTHITIVVIVVPRKWSAIDERQLAGIRVQLIQYTSSPVVRHRFACAGDTNEVSGAVPPDFADKDAFVERFVGA
ncbi:MAG: hypothetical protein M3T56_11680 [Chloroflexota bacterium]|nr:hypothetical protein [Chloroflexota bacterium]